MPCPHIYHLSRRRTGRWLRIILLAMMPLLLSACHSHRKLVVNANNAIVRTDNKPEGTTIEKPMLKGTADNDITRALLDEAYSWLGVPYIYGGEDKNGADCSGFVMQVYLNVLNIKLPRISREQGEYCRKIKKSDLFPGDLVFFKTGKSTKINHVGLYVGDGKMIHASSKGVVVSDMTQQYYIDHYDHSGCIDQYRKMIKK